jgi:hypothetical protein
MPQIHSSSALIRNIHEHCLGYLRGIFSPWSKWNSVCEMTSPDTRTI